MEIWRARYNGPINLVVSDLRPSLQGNGPAAKFELTGTDGVYSVVVTGDEIERLAELKNYAQRRDR